MSSVRLAHDKMSQPTQITPCITHRITHLPVFRRSSASQLVWRDSFVYVTQSYVCYDSFLFVTYVQCVASRAILLLVLSSFGSVGKRDMTQFLYMSWLIRTYDMTHSCVLHYSFACVACLIRKCDRFLKSRHTYSASFCGHFLPSVYGMPDLCGWHTFAKKTKKNVSPPPSIPSSLPLSLFPPSYA